MGGTTTWRGVTLDTRTAQMMDEVVRLCPGVPIDAVQGSYSGSVGASAGTHSGCGAIDLGGAGLTGSQRTQVETMMRRVGFAAWIRSPDQGDWGWHLHGIAVQPGGKGDRGCLSGAAHDQVVDYHEGRNGLADNGPDTGTRAHVGVTWETYRDDDGGRMLLFTFTHANGIWIGDLMHRRPMKSQAQLDNVRWVAKEGGVTIVDHTPGVPVGDPDAFGLDIS